MIVIPIEGRAREWRQVRSEIRRILAGCRELRAVEDIHRITIASSAPDGLSAAIVVDADGFVFQAGPLRLDVPTPVQALSLVEQLVAGFNAAYALDNTYRVAHHGETVVPRSGAGATARPFAMAGSSVVVLQGGGLTVTAFTVDHDPVAPAVGYRFDYKGRAVCISGDTAKSANLTTVCKGADVIVHDALQPRMVKDIEAAFTAGGNASTAKIFADIQDYHASPEQAAESAQEAGARMLVLSHLVPPLPQSYFYPAFLGNAPAQFGGEIVVGEDGMLFSLPARSEAIERRGLL